MAFVLVAIMIFFAIVLLFYFSIRYNSLQDDVETLREEEVLESVRKMSSTPEFIWNAEDCAGCIDMDKVFVLKGRESYSGFWKNIALLQIIRVHPTFEGEECVEANYPECDKITIIEEDSDFRAYSSFVALCRHELEGYSKCELGKIVMAFETIR